MVPHTSPDSAPPYCPQYCTVRLPQRLRSWRFGGGLEGGGGQGEEEEKEERGVAATDFIWVPARVLHVFRNHLDLAVLQLEGGSNSCRAVPERGGVESAGSAPMGSRSGSGETAAACRDAELSILSLVRRSDRRAGERKEDDPPQSKTAREGGGALYATADEGQYAGLYEGQAVLVLGHGLFGPAASWPAAATHGTLAKV